jgi:hypothetical protein
LETLYFARAKQGLEMIAGLGLDMEFWEKFFKVKDKTGNAAIIVFAGGSAVGKTLFANQAANIIMADHIISTSLVRAQLKRLYQAGSKLLFDLSCFPPEKRKDIQNIFEKIIADNTSIKDFPSFEKQNLQEIFQGLLPDFSFEKSFLHPHIFTSLIVPFAHIFKNPLLELRTTINMVEGTQSLLFPYCCKWYAADWKAHESVIRIVYQETNFYIIPFLLLTGDGQVAADSYRYKRMSLRGNPEPGKISIKAEKLRKYNQMLSQINLPAYTKIYIDGYLKTRDPAAAIMKDILNTIQGVLTQEKFF